MHIVVTVNAAWNIWNFRRPLVERLLADGHRVTILAPRDESVEPLVALGCKFQSLKMDKKGLNPVRDFCLLLALRRHFKQLQPDIVLSFTIKNNLYGALAARSLGIPFLPNVTGLGTAFLSTGVLRSVAENLYRIAFSDPPRIFFQNEDDQRLFLQRRLVRPEQARLLPGSGIDLDRFAPAEYPSEEAPVTFLMIARLLRDKGVVEYIEAARLLRNERPELRFQLLGPAGYDNRTAIAAETAQKWQREGLIEYLGACEDVRPPIGSAHCIVLPSYREGAPRTLIEAAALARPLIATDVPGCRAVVDEGETGFLCKARDAGDLARAMRTFADLSHAERKAKGQAGRAKMEREYAVAIVLGEYKKAIMKLT